MAQRASWVIGAADDFSAFLLAARLACLLLLILRFLGGTEERGAGDEPRVAMRTPLFYVYYWEWRHGNYGNAKWRGEGEAALDRKSSL